MKLLMIKYSIKNSLHFFTRLFNCLIRWLKALLSSQYVYRDRLPDMSGQGGLGRPL